MINSHCCVISSNIQSIKKQGKNMNNNDIDDKSAYIEL